MVEDFQQERARALVESVLALGDEPATDWRCGSCGEPVEGQFTACWSCGADRPPGG